MKSQSIPMNLTWKVRQGGNATAITLPAALVLGDRKIASSVPGCRITGVDDPLQDTLTDSSSSRSRFLFDFWLLVDTLWALHQSGPAMSASQLTALLCVMCFISSSRGDRDTAIIQEYYV